MSQKKAQLLNPLNGNLNVTGVVTASSFVGGLTGDVTGDVTGTASTATLANTATVATNAQGLTGTPNVVVGSVTAASGAFSGNVSVGGTLTYQDVEHIDSVGIITAQQGIQVLANGLDITGVSTFKSNVSIAEKIIHTGDTDTFISFPGADAFSVETGGSERIRVDSTGDVGIGTNNPGHALHVLKNGDGQTPVFFETTNGSQGELRFYNDSNGLSLDSGGNLRFVTGRTGSGAPTRFSIDSDGIAAFTNNVSIADTIFHTGDTNTAIRFPAADTFTVETGGSERTRVDSAGRFLIGASTARSNFFNTTIGAALQVEGTDNNTSTVSCVINSTSTDPILTLARSRGSSVGSNTIVQSGDTLGRLIFQGSDGSEFVQAASVICESDGTPGANDMPGRLMFSTTADGAVTPTERMRITSGGGIHFTNGELIERAKVTNGKLSDNTDIDLENGMVHLFTTQETTTSTPNIRINSSTSLNSVMAIGEMISVTLITTAAAGAYSAQLTIDGAAVTENWTGGSAPSDGGSSGVDIHAYTIIKTADATYTVVATQTKTS